MVSTPQRTKDEVVTTRSFTGIFSTDFQPNLVTGA